jgi:hypothetical protein
MKKSFVCMSILLAFALVLTLFVGCLAPEESPKNVIKDEANENEEDILVIPWPSHGVHWKWYESKEGKFRLICPSEWEVDELLPSDFPNLNAYGVLFTHELEMDWGEGLAVLEIASVDEKEAPIYQGKSLYELTEKNMEDTKELCKAQPDSIFKLIEISNTSLAGKPTVEAVWEEGHQNHYGADFSYSKTIFICSRNNGKIYIGIFGATTMPSQEGKNKYWTYEKCLPIFEEMINSFEFL